ncbi:MAG: DUF3592 domain-containing protein [Kiritimatiellae bacterium]|nr:DUF3592 domain-containing protein [Kiritimatiellia bacterium]
MTRIDHPPGLAEKIGRTVFGILFAVIPSLGVFLMARAVPDIRAAAAWTETPCTVLESSSEPAGNGDWRLRVRYRYEADGRTHESCRWTWDDMDESRSVDGIAKRDELLAQYAPGAAATCWVDPSDPARASLEHASAGGHLAGIAFFSLFALVGLGLAVSAWRPRRKRKRRGGPSFGERAAAAAPVIVGAAFLAAGLAIGHFALGTHREALRARDWKRVPATVVRSEVASEWHSGSSDHSGHYSYRPYVVYAYDAGDGVRRESDRYAIGGVSGSSNRGRAETIVAAYPAGRETVAWVDPDDPAASVLADPTAAPGWRSLVPVLIAGLFAAVGACLLAGGLYWHPSRKRRTAPTGGVLRTRRLGTFAGYALVSVVWYAIIGAAATGFVGDGGNAPIEWPPVVIAGVLFLVGLVPLVLSVRALLRLFAPRLEIAIPRGGLAPGASARAAYRLLGDERELSAVRADLVCNRLRAVTEGGRSTNVEAELHRIECLRAARAHEFRRGEFSFDIPADAPASTRGLREKIEWRFEVRLERPGRSAIEDKYPVSVG